MDENDVNITAISKFIDAGEAYLKDNGWRKSGNSWVIPSRMTHLVTDNRYVFFWDAINMQYGFDAGNLKK